LYIAIIAAVVIVSIVAVIRYSDVFAPSPYPGVGKLNSQHEHALFKVFINGESYGFYDEKYYLKNDCIFMDKEGRTIHTICTQATLGLFFDSLGMKFTKDCFVIDDGTSYCNGVDDRTLKFFVNEKPNASYEKYVPKEGDRILIVFGRENESHLESMFRTLRPMQGFGP
jgi:hypothetical protein